MLGANARYPKNELRTTTSTMSFFLFDPPLRSAALGDCGLVRLTQKSLTFGARLRSLTRVAPWIATVFLQGIALLEPGDS